MTRKTQDVLSNLMVYIVLPFSILGGSANKADFSHVINMLWGFVISFGYYVVVISSGLFVMKLRRRPSPNGKVNLTMLTFANVGFLGMPVAQAVLGADGLFYASIFNLSFQVLFYSAGLRLLTNGDFNMRAFVKNPATIALLLFMVFYFTPLSIPAPLLSAITQVGSMLTPLSLIVLGGALYNVKLKSLWSDSRAWIIAAGRLCLIPLALTLILKLLGFSGAMPAAYVITFAMPTGTLIVVFSQKYHTDEEFVARAVALQTVLIFLTIPLFSLLVTSVFL
jgi:predicted permease